MVVYLALTDMLEWTFLQSLSIPLGCISQIRKTTTEKTREPESKKVRLNLFKGVFHGFF